MSHIVYQTADGRERLARFQCSICGNTSNGKLYISPFHVSEKACHVCGPEQGYDEVVNIRAIIYNANEGTSIDQ